MNIKTIVAIAASLLTLSTAARASVVININQVGTNVVAIGSGTIDVGGATGLRTFSSLIFPSVADISFGSFSSNFQGYSVTGPSNFGPGTAVVASSQAGNFGLFGTEGNFFVPVGYVAGALLSGTDTFNNATFSSLGLTQGTYVYTLAGSAQTVTVQIGSAVPEPSTWAMMVLGFAGIGAMTYRRRRTAGSFA